MIFVIIIIFIRDRWFLEFIDTDPSKTIAVDAKLPVMMTTNICN